jgi:hypothetical protein
MAELPHLDREAQVGARQTRFLQRTADGRWHALPPRDGPRTAAGFLLRPALCPAKIWHDDED